MFRLIVLLDNLSVCTVDSDKIDLVGEVVTGKLHDENGLPITATGEVVEVFETFEKIGC